MPTCNSLKTGFDTGNGGPAGRDRLFLVPFMLKRTEMALPMATESFLHLSPDAAMLFAPLGCKDCQLLRRQLPVASCHD